MVLEALVNPIKAKKNPWETFIIGLVYASISIFVSLFLFEQYSSIVMISLTTIVSIPLVYGLIRLEEKKDLEIHEERLLIKEHGKILLCFVFLFLGFLLAFSFWYVVLPIEVTETLFEIQIEAVNEINNPITGNLINTSSTIGIIFFNNLKVLFFCLLFAFFYGFGAILILTWNASVFATVIGEFIRSATGSYILAPIILIKYLLHGIPEITAYFMGGLAGGIISIAVIRHDFGSGKFKHILIDSLDLTILAIILLLFATLIEVFISPLIL